MAKANKYRQAKQKFDAYYFQLLEQLTDQLNEAGNDHDAIARVLTDLGPTLQSAKVARSMLASKLNNNYDHDDFDNDYDEDQEFSSPGPVPATGLKINKDTPLQIGQPILASQSGEWWLATVLSLEPKNKVRVHYDGWEDYFDEVVPRTRIQLREAEDLDEDEEEEKRPTWRRRR